MLGVAPSEMLALASAVLAFTAPLVGPLDTLTSGFASIARLPYGTDVARTDALPPTEPDLILYDIEGNAACRRVRELLTYLDLCCVIKPSATGSASRSVRSTFPALVDGTAGVTVEGADAVCEHLTASYGSDVEPLEAPNPLLLALPDIFRWGRGQTVVAGKRPTPAQPLRLYNYEGNQFCRFVREALCELDLVYEMRGTGKGSLRREELRQLSGKTTAPYLVDPNADVAMGESGDIVAYLFERYGPPA